MTRFLAQFALAQAQLHLIALSAQAQAQTQLHLIVHSAKAEAHLLTHSLAHLWVNLLPLLHLGLRHPDLL